MVPGSILGPRRLALGQVRETTSFPGVELFKIQLDDQVWKGVQHPLLLVQPRPRGVQQLHSRQQQHHRGEQRWHLRQHCHLQLWQLVRAIAVLQLVLLVSQSPLLKMIMLRMTTSAMLMMMISLRGILSSYSYQHHNQHQHDALIARSANSLCRHLAIGSWQPELATCRWDFSKNSTYNQLKSCQIMFIGK